MSAGLLASLCCCAPEGDICCCGEFCLDVPDQVSIDDCLNAGGDLLQGVGDCATWEGEGNSCTPGADIACCCPDGMGGFDCVPTGGSCPCELAHLIPRVACSNPGMPNVSFTCSNPIDPCEINAYCCESIAGSSGVCVEIFGVPSTGDPTCCDALGLPPGCGFQPIFQHEGGCLPDDCPGIGACCIPTFGGEYTCSEISEAECGGQGGTFQGPGTTCTPDPCPQPTQACCFPNGSCSDLTAAACSGSGGTPQGAGTSCATTLCPPPPDPDGACCLPDDSCTVVSSAGCAGLGGTYQGDGVSCTPNPCPCTNPCTQKHYDLLAPSYTVQWTGLCVGPQSDFDPYVEYCASGMATLTPTAPGQYEYHWNGTDATGQNCTGDTNDCSNTGYDIDVILRCVLSAGGDAPPALQGTEVWELYISIKNAQEIPGNPGDCDPSQHGYEAYFYQPLTGCDPPTGAYGFVGTEVCGSVATFQCTCGNDGGGCCTRPSINVF